MEKAMTERDKVFFTIKDKIQKEIDEMGWNIGVVRGIALDTYSAEKLKHKWENNELDHLESLARADVIAMVRDLCLDAIKDELYIINNIKNIELRDAIKRTVKELVSVHFE